MTALFHTASTGIVHIAPAFGEDDANVGRKYNLPFVQLVDAKGDMSADTPFAGKFVKDADPLVLKDLKEKGLLFDAPAFEHSYPHCWRCGTPLIYLSLLVKAVSVTGWRTFRTGAFPETDIGELH